MKLLQRSTIGCIVSSLKIKVWLTSAYNIVENLKSEVKAMIWQRGQWTLKYVNTIKSLG